MKASVAYKTLDNITVVMLAFKNFKQALSDEFCVVNNQLIGSAEESKCFLFFSYTALKAMQTCKARKVGLSAIIIKIQIFTMNKASRDRHLQHKQ